MIEKCELCGEPMPEGEEMFNYHGYSGPCPKPPLTVGSEKRPGAQAMSEHWQQRAETAEAELSQAQQALRWISEQGKKENERCRAGKFVFERPLHPDPLQAHTIHQNEADAWEHLAFWIHTHLWEIVSKAEAALPSDAPEATKHFEVGQRVLVDHPRFHGFGKFQYEKPRVIGVLLENGNTWEYEFETVKLAAERPAVGR